MKRTFFRFAGALAGCALALLTLGGGGALAAIDGLTGATYNLTAKADHISTADGGSVMIWGFADGAGRAQYPGPTLIVDEGDPVTVNLTNELPFPVSIIFPGHSAAAAEGAAPTSQGLITLEAETGGTVSYTFTAGNPGTFMYQSATQADLQVEMGLFGAIIVRPAGYDPVTNKIAYGDPSSAYDREFLFILSAMDPRVHTTVEVDGPAALEGTDYLSNYFPNYWFINGRTGPDTLFPANVMWLPTQPYNIVPVMEPGERLLLRVAGASRALHPFHHHGNHARVIGTDGVFLESAGGDNLSYEVFTIQTVPGETYDAIFEWTGRNLGWDIYGSSIDDPAMAHTCVDVEDNTAGGPGPGCGPGYPTGDCYADTTGSDNPWEWCPDHDKEFPVVLPEKQELAFGGWYSGSAYMGSMEALPPGEGGLNPNSGFAFMWHSHAEKELANYDIFPGGMMTMLIVEPPGTLAPE